MLIFLAGKGGSGKDSILKSVLKRYNNSGIQLERMVYYTTRPMRNGEKQGVDYNFISEQDFVSKDYLGEFLEVRSYNVASGNTYRYATGKYEDKNKVYIMCGSIDQYVKIKERNYDSLYCISIEASVKERIRRMIKRAGDSDLGVIEACRRLYRDEEEAKEFYPDHISYNHDGSLKSCVDDVVIAIQRAVSDNERAIRGTI